MAEKKRSLTLATSVAIIISVSFIIFFIAGLSWKLFVSIGFLLLMIAPYIWSLLQNYQKQRILTLFNPENDPLGSGYHIIQSQIAIGSGGTFGKGWLRRVDETEIEALRLAGVYLQH